MRLSQPKAARTINTARVLGALRTQSNLSKAELARVKASDATMNPARRKAVSKALVEANTAANSMTPAKRKKKA